VSASENAPASPPSSPRPLLRLGDQVVCAVVLGLSLLVMAVVLVAQGYFRGDVIELEEAPPQQIGFQVDINAADWPELTLLPEIGEALARRIVEVRTADGPFLDPDDLRRRVPGIGPRKLAALRPYLQPIAPPAADAAGSVE
jgi:competence protein ComEA